jgi:hypothetical protein
MPYKPAWQALMRAEARVRMGRASAERRARLRDLLGARPSTVPMNRKGGTHG